jgi:hypothetical protein
LHDNRAKCDNYSYCCDNSNIKFDSLIHKDIKSR